jgi:DNA-binding LytR/AlgR family response regulator
MAFVIGICDDSAGQVELLLKFLSDYPGNGGFELIHSTKPQDFLKTLETKRPGLVLLDIDMGETSGIRLGEQIKTRYPDAVVIYITAHEKYALEAFRVRAFHYLLKPLTREDFFRAMDESLAFIHSKALSGPEKRFCVQIKGEFICIPYSDIFYFEKIGHRIKIHTSAREIYYYGNLQELQEQLDGSSFLQCHQGYIVNADKIRSFRDRTLFLEKGPELPVSRSYAEPVREALAKKLFAGREPK